MDIELAAASLFLDPLASTSIAFSWRDETFCFFVAVVMTVACPTKHWITERLKCTIVAFMLHILRNNYAAPPSGRGVTCSFQVYSSTTRWQRLRLRHKITRLGKHGKCLPWRGMWLPFLQMSSKNQNPFHLECGEQEGKNQSVEERVPTQILILWAGSGFRNLVFAETEVAHDR